MTTNAQLHKAALGLPDTKSETVAGQTSYLVGDSLFAALAPDGQAELHMSAESLAKALEKFPAAEQTGPETVLVPLAEVNGMELNGLVYRAWLHRAPVELVSKAQAAAEGNDASGTEHDLPVTIGRPAISALLLAGIGTLDEVANHTEQELLRLHGVGPRAIRLLREALAERQLTLREPS